ncbi:MAG: DDE-type integrase/transposase/recombinase [Candidatus Thiodiazotropha sp.]
MENEKEKYLAKIYTDPSHPASFSGPAKLKQIVDREGKYKISQKDISSFLQKQDSYTVNRPVRRTFRRGHIVTRGIRDQFDLDLIDMGRLSKYNDNVKFLLTAVDAFSRVAMVKPLKDKKAETVLGALKLMLGGQNKCRAVRTDAGAEFKNEKARKFFEAHNIKHFYAHPPLKAQIVERFNQSLKQMIYRYLHNRNTYRYIDKLAAIVNSYNHRPHRALGTLSPSQVTEDNEISLWNEMYINRPYKGKRAPSETAQLSTKSNKGNAKKLRPAAKFTLKVGDLVRISFSRHAFERSFYQRFTEEVFRIRQRIMRDNIPMYMLADLRGEIIRGKFYRPELQPVSQSDEKLFKVEKILKRRGKGSKREGLVRWLGYGPSFDQWVPLSSIESI